MKKLVLLLAVVFSASLFSCGNKAENAAATDLCSLVVTKQKTLLLLTL